LPSCSNSKKNTDFYFATTLLIIAADKGTTSPSGWVRSASVISFSPFAFGSISTNVTNPLPVELLYFTAKPNGSRVNVECGTASEIDSKDFTVQRSMDRETWEDPLMTRAAGSSSDEIHDDEVDGDPSMGVSQYRLVQNDFSGLKTIYDKVAVSMSGTVDNVLIYPNPVTNGQMMLAINVSNETAGVVEIIDVVGKVYFSESIQLTEGNSSFSFGLDQRAVGTYFFRIQGLENMRPQRLVIR
jgi:hypothetical protein